MGMREPYLSFFLACRSKHTSRCRCRRREGRRLCPSTLTPGGAGLGRMGCRRSRWTCAAQHRVVGVAFSCQGWVWVQHWCYSCWRFPRPQRPRRARSTPTAREGLTSRVGAPNARSRRRAPPTATAVQARSGARSGRTTARTEAPRPGRSARNSHGTGSGAKGTWLQGIGSGVSPTRFASFRQKSRSFPTSAGSASAPGSSSTRSAEPRVSRRVTSRPSTSASRCALPGASARQGRLGYLRGRRNACRSALRTWMYESVRVTRPAKKSASIHVYAVISANL